MAKRFTDSEKWSRPWFRQLPPAYKALWIFMLDRCDIAGIWYVDFDLASFMIGEPISPDRAKELFGKQIRELECGARWLINDFAEFQYGKLKPNNNLHNAVIAKLDAINSGANVGLNSPSGGDKEKDKEKEKDSVTIKTTRPHFVKPTKEQVEEYAKSIEFALDGEYFINYYERVGWKYKGQPIVSWQSCVKTWKNNHNKKKKDSETEYERMKRVLGGK